MKVFKRTMLVGALTAAFSLTACTPPNGGASARASGSLALSNDDSTVFAVDTDNGKLLRIDPVSKDVKEITVGSAPVRVIVSPDDTVFVTNSGSRSVSVVRKGDTAESARIDVGIEPNGMALTSDGKTLLVVSATALNKTEKGLLTSIDTNTLQKNWEIEVGEEPRAVAIIAGNRALVSLFKEGELVEVDLGKGEVVRSKTGIYEAANASRQGATAGSPVVSSSFRPRAVSDLIVTPQGDRVFAPVVWAREDSIGRRPNSAGGYYSAGGPCNIGAVATAGIVTVDTGSTPQPQVDDLTSCFTSGTNSADKDFPSSTLASNDPGFQAIQGPTVGVLDPSGSWLMVLSKESKNISFMPAWKRTGTKINFDKTGTSIRTVQKISGSGADGLAVTANGRRIYVYSQFDHKLEIFDGEGTGENSVITTRPSLDNVAPEVLTADLAAGRRLFFDAMDIRMSSSTTNVACSTCHLNGREDGHVWQFPDGPRQTPALAGRKLLSTAPYHWSGEFASLNEFNVHTIKERMGGSGLTATMSDQLDNYIDSLPLAENPLRAQMAGGQAELRGQAAFEKAGCAGCHTGANMTDNTNRDVGTVRLTGANPDNGIVATTGFNVPSLLGIGRTAPYLHDGSQLTLESRVFSNPGDKHGTTSTLSVDERNDLITYLKSL